jgi:DNA mismatch endonuclease (patch repair protein)
MGLRMDIFAPEKRSEVMAAIRSKGNKTTEIALARAFRAMSVKGWRRHVSVAGFKPDFVFPKERLVVFVDGCFWHLCPIHGSVPKSNRDFWLKKLRANAERDARTDAAIRTRGWRVVRFWEHEVKKDVFLCVDTVRNFF